MTSNFYRIWKYPALLAALTIFGLLAALTGSGFWYVLSWTALFVPVIVSIRYGFFPQRVK
jgi:hypothetical protein